MTDTHLSQAAAPGRAATVAAIEATGVVAIIRTKDPARVFDIVSALAEGGVKTLEVTMTVPGAVEVIREVAKALPEGILLGAGTVLDADTVHRVVDAGARFVVAPVFDVGTVRACQERDVPVMPGCYTPTEMLQAWRAGADLIKVFPATSLGPGYLKDVAAPLPQLKLVPTGGVTPQNAGAWIAAGAVAVGIGSALVDNKAVAEGDFGKIEASARIAIAGIREARAAR